MYARALTMGAMAMGGYNMVNGGRKVYEGMKEHNADKMFGGAMQFHQGFTGPLMAGGSFAAKAIHFATTSGARYMSKNEQQELRQNVARATSNIPISR